MMDTYGRPALALTLAVLAVVLLVTRSRVRRRSQQKVEDPARAMLVYDPSLIDDTTGGGMVEISGTIVSPPSVQGPLSKRACSLWEAALLEVHVSEDGRPGHTAIWTTGQAGD